MWWGGREEREVSCFCLTDLDVLSETAEDLLGHHDCPTEVLLAGMVNHILVAVVPVEVHDGLLKAPNHTPNQ